MKCCGKERSSPFCPVCGSKLSKQVLADLLTVLRQKLTDSEQRLNYYMENRSRYRGTGLEDPREGHRTLSAQVSALETVIGEGKSFAAVHSDFLRDNGFSDAARALENYFGREEGTERRERADE